MDPLIASESSTIALAEELLAAAENPGSVGVWKGGHALGSINCLFSRLALFLASKGCLTKLWLPLNSAAG